MIRLLATVALSLLLLGMQHRLVAHELEHVGARLNQGEHATLHLADGGACLECALLAGGSGATPVDDIHAGHAVPRSPAPLAAAYASPRLHAPAAYLSRAPPSV